MTKKKCGNCKRRAFSSWDGMNYCMDYEMTTTEAEEIEAASKCPCFEEGTPHCLERDEDYMPSSTYEDYSPSNPWDAPGMSVRDFI